MITALIRTNNRPELLMRCLESLHWQSYKNWTVVLSFDKHPLPELYYQLPSIDCSQLSKEKPFFYDEYCIYLTDHVKENSWFFFLDDDDYLTSPDALLNISKYLTDPDKPVICQFLRNGVPKPAKNQIVEGKIGLPCLFLHAKWKHLVSLDGYKAGDYRMIKSVAAQLGGYVWAPVVVVETDRRSFGK